MGFRLETFDQHRHHPLGVVSLVEGVLALLLIVAGVALWSIPAALIVAGVLLLVDRIT